ncbi:hypothetical protein PanWU01x14_030200 [Parasponia andersonii]|uniref:Transmembrane protein n=1 Tax=Parasponia andersonii TaxID=3476 RepID=A0A2P5DUP2_PARAD|nr:hypothetical protein PanWU01x14_030200 [Parasponia andersonii]
MHSWVIEFLSSSTICPQVLEFPFDSYSMPSGLKVPLRFCGMSSGFRGPLGSYSIPSGLRFTPNSCSSTSRHQVFALINGLLSTHRGLLGPLLIYSLLLDIFFLLPFNIFRVDVHGVGYSEPEGAPWTSSSDPRVNEEGENKAKLTRRIW